MPKEKSTHEGLGRVVHQLSVETGYSTVHIRELLKRFPRESGLKRKEGSNRWLVPAGSYPKLKKLVMKESGLQTNIGVKKGQ